MSIRRLPSASVDPDPSERVVAGEMPEPIVHGLEVVDVGDEDRERLIAPAGALELDLERALEAATVREPGQRVGVGCVGERLHERQDPGAEERDQRTGDHERAEREDESVERHTRRLEHRQDDAVGTCDERDLRREQPGIEEVRRVEADPEVEERVGARFVAGEVDGARDETGPDRDDEDEEPHGQPLEADDEHGRDAVGAAGERDDPDLVRLRGVRQRQRQQSDGRCRDEDPVEDAHHRDPVLSPAGSPPPSPGQAMPEPGPHPPTIGSSSRRDKPFCPRSLGCPLDRHGRGWFSRRNDNGGSCEHHRQQRAHPGSREGSASGSCSTSSRSASTAGTGRSRPRTR